MQNIIVKCSPNIFDQLIVVEAFQRTSIFRSAALTSENTGGRQAESYTELLIYRFYFLEAKLCA